MYSWPTPGSTQPGERPVTTCSGHVLSRWQHAHMGHATKKRSKQVRYVKQANRPRDRNADT